VRWWRKAAEQNFAPAQHDLGNCYANGHSVTIDFVEAYKWYLLAAAQGDEFAKNTTPKLEGLLTREQRAEGQKRAGDFKPMEFPSLDAQQAGAYGNPSGNPPYGMYSRRISRQQGAADGSPLADLRAKAETGDAQAQNELGEALYAGKRGVAKNAVEAVKWFRQAAEQNLAAAQSNLGVCYEHGDGVAKYEVEAYKWDLLAAAQGDTKAKHNASLLELLLSQEQIAEGKRRTQDWLEQRKTTSLRTR
jgi:TPR repeat protein